jgi:hypothetical protein
MDLTVFAKEVYLYFTSRVYSRAADGFCKTPKSIEAFDHFGKVFTERYGSVGPEYVWFYVVFQFSKYELVNFRPKGFVPFVTPTMVFGKKAIKDFGHRKTIDNLTMNEQWVKDKKITKADFVRQTGFTFGAGAVKVNLAKAERKLQEYQDPIKAATVKFATGPESCYEMTDLYNDQDASCQICPYVKECKAYLQEVNPGLFNLRDYE